MNLRDDLDFRGLVHQITDDGASSTDSSAGGVTAYIGFDPTAPSLHLGSLLQLCNLRRLQLRRATGPIALAGGGTGLIGDPSFKDVERPLLSVEADRRTTSRASASSSRASSTSRRVAGAAQALLLNNADWLTTISLTDFLRDVGKHFTVNQMVAKESVQEPPRPRRRRPVLHRVLLHAAAGLRLPAPRTSTTAARSSSADRTSGATSPMGTELVRKVTRGHGRRADLAAAAARRRARSSASPRAATRTSGSTPTMTSPFAMHQFLLNSDDEITPDAAALLHLPRPRRRSLELDDATRARAPGAARAARARQRGRGAGARRGRRAPAPSARARRSSPRRSPNSTRRRCSKSSADAPSSTWSRARSCAPGIDAADAPRALRPGEVQGRGPSLPRPGRGLREQRATRRRRDRSTLDAALHDRYVVVRRGAVQLHLVVVA